MREPALLVACQPGEGRLPYASVPEGARHEECCVTDHEPLYRDPKRSDAGRPATVASQMITGLVCPDDVMSPLTEGTDDGPILPINPDFRSPLSLGKTGPP